MAEKVSRIRTGEIRVVENLDEQGEGERVIEKWVEGDLQLEERIVEKVRNEVYERTIDTIVNDEVVDRKVESTDPVSSRLQLVEHIATTGVSAMSVEEEEPRPIQKLVAKRVGAVEGEPVQKKSKWFLWALGLIIAAEVAIFAYIYCM